jgi:lysine 2,3-aminomutase
MPNYLVSASDDAVVLRNYEGMLVRYQAEDKPGTNQPTGTRGVSALLTGNKSALIPENSERMVRRQLNVLSNPTTDHHEYHGPHEHNGHSNGHSNGCGHNGNGHGNGIAEELIPLGVLVNGCGS